MKSKFYKWTVEFQVSDNWVKDGFNFTDENALDMLKERLQMAYPHEIKAKVVKAPSVKSIRKEQGYE